MQKKTIGALSGRKWMDDLTFGELVKPSAQLVFTRCVAFADVDALMYL